MSDQSIIKPGAPDRRLLGKYEVLSRLSQGGMSEIYLASQAGLGGFRKLVVLKTILPDISGEDDFIRMFLEEARMTALFNHPNIAQVFELDVDGGTLFMSMEFVQGCTLVEMARACRQAKEPIPIGFTLASVRDTALALHYAHNFTDPRGRKQIVIHRDVAEKNIMVTYEGVTKLLDFGIAKALGRSTRTNVGMVKGTSGYMSPEQIRGEPLDCRSDIFSAGVVLHECLTGMRLFFGKSAHEGMLAVLKEDVAKPSKTNPAVTPEIDAVVLKSLQRAREDRYSTALEFARAIEKAAPGMLWLPEQTAELVAKHFTQRRMETRRMLEAASYGNEGTGEISINKVMERVRASGDARVSISGPRPTVDVPKKDAPPPQTATPPLPVPALKQGPTPKPAPRPEPVTAPVPARAGPSQPRAELVTVAAKPAVSKPQLEVIPASSLQDDDDESDAKTLPAKALPAELRALRDRMKAERAAQLEMSSAQSLLRGGPLVAAVSPAARPSVPVPEPRTDPARTPGQPPRSISSDTLSVTGRNSNPFQDDDEPEAKTTLASPYKSSGSKSPGQTTDKSAQLEPETSGTSPTLQPVGARTPAPAPKKAPAPKRGPLLAVALFFIVVLTSLGVLYLLDLPPFKGLAKGSVPPKPAVEKVEKPN